jgi:serine/threonine protein kinase
LNSAFQVKLADLGLARKVEANEMSETFCGTPLYMAPEVARGDPYDNTADIWSIGCMLYQLLVGYLPFTANNAFQLVKVLEEGTYFLPKFVEVSDDCVRILTQCLQYDSKKRLNWQDLINDPYITNRNHTCKSIS